MPQSASIQVTMQISPASSGNTYYVATNGSDSNPGTITAPFRTINKGVSVLTPGDTLLIRGGTYLEGLANKIPGGTAAAPVTVSAYPGSAPYEVVVMQPTSVGSDASIYFADSSRTHIIFQGIAVDGVNAGAGKDCVKITYGSTGASSFITIKDCEVKNSNGHQGILIAGNPPSQDASNNQVINCKIHNNGNSNLHHGIYCTSSNNLFDGNECYSNAGYGIQIYHASGHDSNWCSNNIVRNNKIHDNNTAGSGSGGIVIATGDNNLLYNNIVWNNTAGGVGGIQCYNGVNGTQIYNNTCYNNSDSGIHIQTNCTNTVARNNILYHNVSVDIINNGMGSIIDHNTTNNQDPKFVSLGTDFHLLSGSPAIDTGVTLTQVPVDLDGISRPQGTAYDIGAYEFH